ncbi:hypothetical protein Pla163_17400 [Planctomycetes bacterium Pla163]|uniref:DUF4175 family protein n=1 Tax=Rohdeia mirabilis TaxID=2528008 RepID=A0A518CZH2_9BACT|nr:hypothetical protein Pla163_17400 [Planctomycetes bacterium Pla163]
MNRTNDDVRLERTPELARALDRLGRLLARAAWVEGTGRVLLVLGLWVGLAFLADWSLDLPRVVRLLSLAGLVTFVAATVWRRLILPLRALPGRSGLALLLERGLPQREELLVSAVDLQRHDRQSEPALTRALTERLLERAEKAAGSVRASTLVDLRPGARRAVLGAVAVGLAAVPLVASPLANVFAARLVGADLPWPRRTTLELEVLSGAIVENPGEEELRLIVPRGGDVTLSVRAVDGSVTPDSVRVSSTDSLPQVLMPDSRGVFRAVLRSVTRADRLVVTGGDDDDGRPNATITIVDPPDLSAVVLEVIAPPYAGIGPRRFVNTGGTALMGSTLRIWAATTPVDCAAQLALLPTERVVDVERRAAPTDLVDELGSAPVLFHELRIEESLRLRFDLTDDRGLTSPDPALFAIDAIEDRAPEVVRLVPSRSDVETSATGAVRVVLALRDDFGLADATWVARAGGDGPIVAQGRLDLVPAVEGTDGEWHTTLRFELPELLGEGDGIGSQIAVEFTASDRATPPQIGRDDTLRLRVLGNEELMRRVKDRLGRARGLGSSLSERLVESRRRAEELASLVDEAEITTGDEATGLRAALALARRAESDGRTLVRELTSVCEMVLYARLDEKADGLLETLDRELADRRSRTFDADPWRRVVEKSTGDAATAEGFGSHLVSIAALALELMDGPLTTAATALDEAAAARDPETLAVRLFEASDAARDGTLLVEALLERLAEWDNYQSVLSLTRDLLERQKSLSERTKRFASDR